jgi:hypothetical protein
MDPTDGADLQKERLANSAKRKRALKFVLMIGVVSFFADFTYEGSRSITGPWRDMRDCHHRQIGSDVLPRFPRGTIRPAICFSGGYHAKFNRIGFRAAPRGPEQTVVIDPAHISDTYAA